MATEQNPSLNTVTTKRSSIPISQLPGKEIAKLLGLEWVEKLGEPDPPRDLLRGDFDRIAGSWGRQYSIVPIKLENEEVLVATSNPLAVEAIDQLRLCYKFPLKIVVTTPEEVT